MCNGASISCFPFFYFFLQVREWFNKNLFRGIIHYMVLNQNLLGGCLWQKFSAKIFSLIQIHSSTHMVLTSLLSDILIPFLFFHALKSFPSLQLSRKLKNAYHYFRHFSCFFQYNLNLMKNDFYASCMKFIWAVYICDLLVYFFRKKLCIN